MALRNGGRFNAPKTDDPLIRRHDHHHFHGWVCVIKRRDRLFRKYFSDKPGGRTASLRRARLYRDRLIEKLAPPVKLKRTFVRNTTGVVGVALTQERSRAGTPTNRYVVHIPRADGRPGKVSFSLAKYGPARAFQLAVKARERAVAAFIAERKRMQTAARRRKRT